MCHGFQSQEMDTLFHSYRIVVDEKDTSGLYKYGLGYMKEQRILVLIGDHRERCQA